MRESLCVLHEDGNLNHFKMRTMITKWLPVNWRQKTKALVLLMAAMICGQFLFAQAPSNDECAGAIALTPPSATCTNTAGTTVGATLSMAATPCFGNPDDDVWFSFVATATDVKIEISSIVAVSGGSTDMYFQVFSGTCGSLTSITCSDPNSTVVGDLVIGQTYYIRAYLYGTGSTATFNICLTNVTTAPGSCPTLNNPANNSVQSLTPTLSWGSVTNAASYDIYVGTTNPPTTISGTVNGTYSNAYTIPTALSAGDYYWYVVARNNVGAPTSCTTNTRKFTAVAPPSNNECINAKVLVQGATCVNTTDSTTGATMSMAAAPCAGNPDDDVWYSFVATAPEAKIDLSSVSSSTDMYFQVFSGACGSLTSLLCSDPNSNTVSGLTVGQTYYIRVFTYGSGLSAKYNICVTTLPVPACTTLGDRKSVV